MTTTCDQPAPALRPRTTFNRTAALNALTDLYECAGLPAALARKSARADFACGLAPGPEEIYSVGTCVG
ncbi:MAG: hypothetical protein ABI680_21175 [Chthoniobacteraceae bacterium]